MRNPFEAFSRLRHPEIPACKQFQISQDLAEAVVESFLAQGGRKALEKNQRHYPYPLVITSGSYATVYHVCLNDIHFSIKEAKYNSEAEVYCASQLRGQELLVTRNYPHFAPYCPVPVTKRYLVQRYLVGTPSYNITVRAEINDDLADYGLYIADPKANAILGGAFRKPILIDFSEIEPIQ